jgi:hypothetical protein
VLEITDGAQQLLLSAVGARQPLQTLIGALIVRFTSWCKPAAESPVRAHQLLKIPVGARQVLEIPFGAQQLLESAGGARQLPETLIGASIVGLTSWRLPTAENTSLCASNAENTT